MNLMALSFTPTIRFSLLVWLAVLSCAGFAFAYLSTYLSELQRYRSEAEEALFTVDSRLRELDERWARYESVVGPQLEALQRIEADMMDRLAEQASLGEALLRATSELNLTDDAFVAAEQSEPVDEHTLDERFSRARDTIREWCADSAQEEVLRDYKKNVRHWTEDVFLQDPRLNPNQVVLTPEELLEFKLLLARAASEVRSCWLKMDLIKELAIVNDGGVLNDINEPQPARAFAVSLRGNVRATFTEEDYPELPVLSAEVEARIVNCLATAKAFLGTP
jgi:hypothetical protein